MNINKSKQIKEIVICPTCKGHGIIKQDIIDSDKVDWICGMCNGKGRLFMISSNIEYFRID